MATIKHVYFGDLTAKRGDDGNLYVKGLATDATLDLDEQICDPDWLKTAMPKWMEIGNIREMHQSKAVGKAVEMEQSGTGFLVEAKIGDPSAQKMVEEGIYTGFSVGIKNARVVKDASAPGGRIISGNVVEVSLVDRPANPSAVIEIAKTIDGDLVKGVAVADVEKAESPELNAEAVMTEEAGSPTEVHERTHLCASCAGTGKKTNVEGNTQETDCDVCGGTGEQPSGQIEDIEQNSPTIPEIAENQTDLKTVEADVPAIEPAKEVPAVEAPIVEDAPVTEDAPAEDAEKALVGIAKGLADLTKMEHDPADLNAVRASLIALIKAELDEMIAGEEDETSDVGQLLYALSIFLNWWTSEASENETSAPFTGWDEEKDDDTMAYIGLGVSPDIIKGASAPDASDEAKAELRLEIVKALGLEETISAKADLSEAKEQIELLKAALDEVKQMATPGGPALRATNLQNQKSAQATAHLVEAESLRIKAASITNPELKAQYLMTAKQYEDKASQF